MGPIILCLYSRGLFSCDLLLLLLCLEEMKHYPENVRNYRQIFNVHLKVIMQKPL